MLHYIYKITFLKGTPEGRYYIGKRSTGEYDNGKEDPYAGSGIFCNNFFEEYGKIEGVTYRKECLEENNCFEENREREKYGIGDLGKLDPLCMNKISGGGGVTLFDDIYGKPVYQFDFNGNLLAEYKSVSEASRITNIWSSSISKCCLKKAPYARHYIGRFDKNDLSIKDVLKAAQSYGMIDQYTKDGIFIKSGNSVKEAADKTNSCASAISACINHKKNRYLCNGYIGVRYGESPINNKKRQYCGSVKVVQYDESGNLLAIYNSYKEAAIAVGGKGQGIQRVCDGKRLKHCGFIGAKEGYKPCFNENISKTYKIEQYTKEGILVNTYISAKEAAAAIKGKADCIRIICRKNRKNNKRHQTYKGYIGKYVD